VVSGFSVSVKNGKNQKNGENEKSKNEIYSTFFSSLLFSSFYLDQQMVSQNVKRQKNKMVVANIFHGPFFHKKIYLK